MMKTRINEYKYKLDEIIDKRGYDWTAGVKSRFNRYLKSVFGELERSDKFIEARTNTYGLSLCNKRVFVWVGVRSDFFIVQCFSGTGKIKGLPKATNWGLTKLSVLIYIKNVPEIGVIIA